MRFNLQLFGGRGGPSMAMGFGRSKAASSLLKRFNVHEDVRWLRTEIEDFMRYANVRLGANGQYLIAPRKAERLDSLAGDIVNRTYDYRYAGEDGSNDEVYLRLRSLANPQNRLYMDATRHYQQIGSRGYKADVNYGENKYSIQIADSRYDRYGEPRQTVDQIYTELHHMRPGSFPSGLSVPEQYQRMNEVYGDLRGRYTGRVYARDTFTHQELQEYRQQVRDALLGEAYEDRIMVRMARTDRDIRDLWRRENKSTRRKK